MPQRLSDTTARHQADEQRAEERTGADRRADRADAAAGRGGHRAALAGLACDVGLPLIGYYTLHGFGASDWAALLTATAAAGARLVWVAARTRRVTWFAAVMLAVFGAGTALAFTGGDPRVLLLKDSATTVMIGAVFLISLLGERPFTLSAAQTWRPAQAQRLGELYRSEPAARRAFRVSALGWGAGLLGEATLRAPLVYLLPVDVMVGLSTAMMIIAMAGLAVWNAAYIARAARRTPALSILLPGHRAGPDES
jgi:hypothetical protein